MVATSILSVLLLVAVLHLLLCTDLATSNFFNILNTVGCGLLFANDTHYLGTSTITHEHKLNPFMKGYQSTMLNHLQRQNEKTLFSAKTLIL